MHILAFILVLTTINYNIILSPLILTFILIIIGNNINFQSAINNFKNHVKYIFQIKYYITVKIFKWMDGNF